MERRPRIGFIGCGRHATRVLYPSLALLDVDLVAVACREAERAERTARRFGARRWYGDHRALLAGEGELDGVVVAVPAPAYGAILDDVIARGVACWAEKPAAASAAEAEQLAVAASKAGVPVLVGFMKRFATAYRLMADQIAAPTFGRPTYFEGRFSMGGGLYGDDYTFLVDNSIHLVDLARWLMGDVADLDVRRTAGPEGRVAYAVVLGFTDGAVGSLHLSTMRSWRADNERVEVTGVGPSVAVENLVRVVGTTADGAPGTFWEPNFSVPIDENRTIVLAGYVPELAHFIDVVQGDQEPQVGLRDAVEALRLIDRIYDAGGAGPRPARTSAAW